MLERRQADQWAERANHESSGSNKANWRGFGHVMSDTWVRPLMISDAIANLTHMFFESFDSVFNPSRVFFTKEE